MSLQGLEHALYDLGVDRVRRKAFLEDPDAFLASYVLSEAEAGMLRAFDVHAMQAAGVNPMLSMGYWATTESSRSMTSYLAALNPPSPE